MITSTLAALAFALSPATPAADGLVAHYPLEQSSGTTATDTSGNGRDATVSGDATWRGPEGLQLGGANGYVKLPDNLLRGLSAVSVSLQVRLDPAQPAPYFIWGIGNTTNSLGNGYLFTTGNAYRTSIATGNWATEQTVTKGADLARGTWKTLTYTLGANTGVLYEDGVELARATNITTLPSAIGNGTTTADYIGRSVYTSDRYLKGSVRDFRVYDHALTPGEVSALGAVSDADRVARDAAALSLVSTTTSDLPLPTAGANGASIVWTSDTPAVISTAGKVTRPAAGQGDATVRLTAAVSRGSAGQTREFTVTVPALPADPALAEQAAAALQVVDASDVRGNLTLPTAGLNGASVSWSSSDASVVTPTGEVTRGAAAKTVKLTAAVKVGGATVQRAFDLTVRAKAVREPYAGYAFSYFTGEGSANGEQIYFAASRGNDALHWDELNGGRPALTSQFGDKGVRDPFLIRSPEGDKFFLIATDLKIYGNGNWDVAQRSGSKYIEVWESTDLVHWSDQRHVRVAPDTAGNTWAPEAYYDDALGAYVVFWASKLYDAADTGHAGNTYNRMMYATTRDFRTFSEPKVWIDPGYSVIDSTVVKNGETYYRFTKDERNNTSSTPCSKFIVEQKASSLLDLDWDLVADCIGKANADGPGISQGEGPTIFKANGENKWYLFIDEFGGRGYVPFESTDLDSGKWKLSTNYELPARPRHGTVLPVTAAELARLRNEPDPVKANAQGLIAGYTTAGTGTTLTDASGNGYDATLNGDVTRGDDGLTFGGTNGYVKLPDNLMAGLDAITVSTDVWLDPGQATPYFIYGLGNTSNSAGNGYLFTTGNGYRTSITPGNYSKEQTAGTDNLQRGAWHQLTYTLAGGTAILYLDGTEVARNENVTVRPGDIGLGRTTVNYIGRSLYSADRYFKGRIGSFSLYNRALSPAEVRALSGVSVNAAGEVSGHVPATLGVMLGAQPSFGAFVPEVDRTYSASTTATVMSSAGDAKLSVSDPSSIASGHLVNGLFALRDPLLVGGSSLPATLKRYTGPVTNDVVPVELRQHIGAIEPLRTGTYAKTLRFSLSTTTP